MSNGGRFRYMARKWIEVKMQDLDVLCKEHAMND